MIKFLIMSETHSEQSTQFEINPDVLEAIQAATQLTHDLLAQDISDKDDTGFQRLKSLGDLPGTKAELFSLRQSLAPEGYKFRANATVDTADTNISPASIIIKSLTKRYGSEHVFVSVYALNSIGGQISNAVAIYIKNGVKPRGLIKGFSNK